MLNHYTLFSWKQKYCFTQNLCHGRLWVMALIAWVHVEMCEFCVQYLHIYCSKYVCNMHMHNIMYPILFDSCIIIDLTLPTAYSNVTKSWRRCDTQMHGRWVCAICKNVAELESHISAGVQYIILAIRLIVNIIILCHLPFKGYVVPYLPAY